MYKCLDCGNTEKFIGKAREKGCAEIYKIKGGYEWSYKVSENSWESSFTIQKCYYCNSENIIKI